MNQAVLHTTVSTISVISTGTIFMFQQEIKKFAKNVYNYFRRKLMKKLIIDKDTNPKSAFAVGLELESYIKENKKSNQLMVRDGTYGPIFKLAPGKYSIRRKEFGEINIKIASNKLTLYSYTNSMENIKNFVAQVYQQYCSPERVTVFFTSESDKWSFPIFRDSKNFREMDLTNEMALVIKDVDKFMASREEYLKNHVPYRRGYMLKGAPGTGKSTIIEVIAAKYNMSVYLLNLNSNNMCDTTLINLISKVPKNSIVAIEEIDKQLLTLEKNTNNKISFGGLLSALDGPQRLNDSCIIILTTNDDNFLNDENRFALFRTGRIDDTYELSEKIKDKIGKK